MENDDTQPMEEIKAGPIHAAGDPWSVQTWTYRDMGVALGYVTIEASHPLAPPDKPWLAYLTPVGHTYPLPQPFQDWFTTADLAKAAVNAVADQFRAIQKARTPR